MGLYYPALLYAIKTRLQADSTLVGYMGGATTPEKTLNIVTTFPRPAVDPRGTTYPYVAIWPVSDTIDDSFMGRKVEVMFEVHLYVEGSPQTADPTLLKMTKQHERVIGDWPSHSNRTPAYGLDRWFPDFTGNSGDAVTSYVPDMVVYRGFQDLTDPMGDRREWVLTFATTLQLVAA